MDLFEGLESNNLTNYTHLLTGYVNSPETLKNLMKIYTKLKATNPNLIYGTDISAQLIYPQYVTLLWVTTANCTFQRH